MKQRKGNASRVGGVACLLIAVCWVVFSTNEKGPNGSVSESIHASPFPKTMTDREKDEMILNRTSSQIFFQNGDEGMGPSEVRWVVNDLRAAGIDQYGPLSETDAANLDAWYDLRRKRQDWYLYTITSALALTKDQQRQARTALENEGRKEYEGLLNYLKEAGPEKVAQMLEGPIEERKFWKLGDGAVWLGNSACLPWNLCDLNADQKKATWDTTAMKTAGVEDNQVSLSEANWFGNESDSIDSSSFPPLLDSSQSSVGSPTAVGGIFPLTPQQQNKFREPLPDGCKTPLLLRCMILQKEQLRMLLLLVPDISQELASELETLGH